VYTFYLSDSENSIAALSQGRHVFFVSLLDGLLPASRTYKERGAHGTGSNPFFMFAAKTGP
jgi:hypothetical protein